VASLERKNIFANIDWIMVVLYLILVVMGWFNIFAAAYNDEHPSIFDITQNYGKQMMWIGTAILIALSILLIDAKFYNVFGYLIYGIIMIILAGVLVLGVKVNGARSWYQMGGFALQPSEFVKFAVTLALAKYLSSRDVNIQNVSSKIISAIIILKVKRTIQLVLYSEFIKLFGEVHSPVQSRVCAIAREVFLLLI